jgi:hypothetical protein
MATLPPEWRLMGVVRGPREVNPKISIEGVRAVARGCVYSSAWLFASGR